MDYIKISKILKNLSKTLKTMGFIIDPQINRKTHPIKNILERPSIKSIGVAYFIDANITSLVKYHKSLNMLSYSISSTAFLLTDVNFNILKTHKSILENINKKLLKCLLL